MKTGRNKEKTGSLLALLLFAVFAVCVLLVLLTGAEVYKGLTERGRAGYEGRTAAQYLAVRLRQGDAAGGIRLEDFGGVDALVLSQKIGGETYETWVYCSGGYLRELFSQAGAGFAPEDGDAVLPLESMTLRRENAVLQAELTEMNGEVRHVVLYPRSGEEAAP